MSLGDIAFRAFMIAMAPAVILCIIFVAIAPIWLVYEAFQVHPTIVLKLSDWECTATYKHKVFTGKVWITREDCSTYTIKSN